MQNASDASFVNEIKAFRFWKSAAEKRTRPLARNGDRPLRLQCPGGI
jgi:hypothetical protein